MVRKLWSEITKISETWVSNLLVFFDVLWYFIRVLANTDAQIRLLSSIRSLVCCLCYLLEWRGSFVVICFNRLSFRLEILIISVTMNFACTFIKLKLLNCPICSFSCAIWDLSHCCIESLRGTWRIVFFRFEIFRMLSVSWSQGKMVVVLDFHLCLLNSWNKLYVHIYSSLIVHTYSAAMMCWFFKCWFPSIG